MSRSYFEGTLVRLRPMEPEDLDLLYRMENDPETWDVSNFSVPYSRYVLKQYIEDSQCDMFADKQLRLMIVRRTDDVVVGTVDVTDFAPMHRRGEVGIAVRKEFRGNGYAGEALTLMCDYLFRFLFVHQLTAHVAVDNEASRRLFAGAGRRRTFLPACSAIFAKGRRRLSRPSARRWSRVRRSRYFLRFPVPAVRFPSPNIP